MVSDCFQRAQGPVEEGWPLPEHAVHPPELAATLAGLRVHPDQLLPETIEPFIPLAREIDQDKDKRLAGCMRTLAECMSVHSAAVWLLDQDRWDFGAVYYDAIDHLSHGFMRYHPPRQSWIGERDFELYHNVVSTAYQFHDEMLGALLRKCGDETVVVLMSDHGFHPDQLRPASIPDIPAGPAVEHRDLGILAIGGPGIRKGEWLHGASVLDVAPTILAVYGLPVGEDMDGKVLSQAFVEAPEPGFIPSWEEVHGVDGRHPAHTRLDPAAAHAALEQLIALGYVERPEQDGEGEVEKTVRELRYNLGQAYQDDDRHIEAREIFSGLWTDDPSERRFAVRLFVSCDALGMQEEMRRIVDDMNRSRRCNAPLLAEYLKARVLTCEKRYGEALAVLERVAEAQPAPPGLLLEIAGLHLRLGQRGDTEYICEEVLAVDPDNAHAHVGLCRVAIERKQFSVAAQAALEALQRVHHYPLAHFLLGRALGGMKEYERAAEAFRAAISLNPNFPEAHVRLASLLRKHLGDAASAREHMRLTRRMKRRETIPNFERKERDSSCGTGNSADGGLDKRTGRMGAVPASRYRAAEF
jgi:tetratricopeptide (TPR) repeat protein